jgi:hypothetical protein
MRLKIVFVAAFLLLFTHLNADIDCDDLEIKQSSSSDSCSTCTQGASGTIEKTGSDSGRVCVFLCATHSYNVCDHSVLIGVGTDFDQDCYDVDSETSEITWYFSSDRDNWSSQSLAEIYLWDPCITCSVNKIPLMWETECYYCPGCE